MRHEEEMVASAPPGPGPEDNEHLERAVHELAGMLFAGQTTEATLEAVASLAQRVLPGCESVSVTLVKGGRPTTTNSTGAVATHMDKTQYESGRGPCLEAMQTQQVVRVDSLDDATSWPAFKEEAETQGMGSVLSLPLTVGHDAVGALNLYSLDPAAFRASEGVGLMFARQAAITLANAQALRQAEELAQQLAVALEHRDVIGQAKGILMERSALSSEEAFDVLRRASQRSNRKLYDIATEIVARREKPGPAAGK